MNENGLAVGLAWNFVEAQALAVESSAAVGVTAWAG
jgi:hypothetical protein